MNFETFKKNHGHLVYKYLSDDLTNDAALLINDLNLIAQLCDIEIPMEFWTQDKTLEKIEDKKIKRHALEIWEQLKEIDQYRQKLFELLRE